MTRIPDHLLPIVDRMAMAHGVEVRPPFLEHEVVEFGMRLPVRLKVRRGRLKMALRRVAARHLDEEIVNRPKHGFGFPLGMWMRARLRPVLTGALADSRFVEAGLFEREFLTELLREHTGGERDHSYRLWMLLNLEVWHRVFLEGKTRDGVLEWIEGLDAPGELPGGASAAAT